MKTGSARPVAYLFWLWAFAGSVAGHPIEDVIKMIKGLKEKSIALGKQESAEYGQFTYWCSDTTKTLKDAISEEKDEIEELTNLLQGKAKEKENLEKDIDKLDDEITALINSQKKAKETRDKESKLFDKELQDLEDTITAVDGALTELSAAESKTESLLEQRSQLRKVLSFVELDASVSEAQLNLLRSAAEPAGPIQLNLKPVLVTGDEAAHVDKYDFKSESVVELLKELLKKFEDDKVAVTKAETNAVNAYNLASDARANAQSAAEKSKGKKSKSLSDVKGEIAEAKEKKENAEDDLKADSTSLEDTESACATKTDEWEKRSKTRELELEAMDAAVEILAKTSGVRTEAPGNPIPPASPVFLQLTTQPLSSKKQRVITLIKEAATKAKSHALERLAVEISAHMSGPGAFDQINNMIEKMIFRLMDEQRSEDEHKLWCDKELKKTNVMKKDKEDRITDLQAELDVQTAAISKLSVEIQEADELIEKIVTFKAEATEIRSIGKKENAEAIKDSEDAQKALTGAIAVLTDFYKDSGMIKKKAWEFVQAPIKVPEDPSTWDSGYTGIADPNSGDGILAMLEKVMADFSKMEAETRSQEEIDQKEYETAMSDNDIEKARREQESKMKVEEKKRRVDKVAHLTGQKKDTSSELEKTEQYLEDLQPACVSGDSSYEDRKAARDAEVKALQQAQSILGKAFDDAGGDGSFLSVRRHRHQ